MQAEACFCFSSLILYIYIYMSVQRDQDSPLLSEVVGLSPGADGGLTHPESRRAFCSSLCVHTGAAASFHAPFAFENDQEL